MTLELIRRELAPGAVHVPGWLGPRQQRFLVQRCREWAARSPRIRATTLPGGARMSVRTVCLGWRWIPYRVTHAPETTRTDPPSPRSSHGWVTSDVRPSEPRQVGGRHTLRNRSTTLDASVESTIQHTMESHDGY